MRIVNGPALVATSRFFMENRVTDKQPIIDVWDVATFDPDLVAILEANEVTMRAYFDTENEIFLSFDLERDPERPPLRPENPHAGAFYRLLDTMGSEMKARSIRAFHYTRLTGDEVERLSRSGIHVSTPETLRRRLDAVVASGELTADAADQLYAKSPFHGDQLAVRSGKFWLSSHPVIVDDGGVAPLMVQWGGEVTSMWVRGADLAKPLRAIGRRRIVEVAVPMSATTHSHNAGNAVVATFARWRGALPEKSAFDLYVTTALPPAAVIKIHTEGEPTFATMARDYPAGYVDVGVTRWKELTGEDD